VKAVDFWSDGFKKVAVKTAISLLHFSHLPAIEKKIAIRA